MNKTRCPTKSVAIGGGKILRPSLVFKKVQIQIVAVGRAQGNEFAAVAFFQSRRRRTSWYDGGRPGLHLSRHFNRNHAGTWSSHNPQQGLQVRGPCPIPLSFVCCSSLCLHIARRVGGISPVLENKRDLLTCCSRKTEHPRIFAFRFACGTS